MLISQGVWEASSDLENLNELQVKDLRDSEENSSYKDCFVALFESPLKIFL